MDNHYNPTYFITGYDPKVLIGGGDFTIPLKINNWIWSNQQKSWCSSWSSISSSVFSLAASLNRPKGMLVGGFNPSEKY